MNVWWRRLTLDQWRAIDESHREGTLPDVRPMAVLVTAAFSLILPHYFGRTQMYDEFAWVRALLAELPHLSLRPHVYWAAFKLVNYGILPALCIKLVLRGRLRDYGVRWVHEPRIWLLYAGMVLVVLPVAYLASTTPAFLRTYPKYADAGQSLEQFLIWELAYGFQFFMLEFFFRGFFLFSLARYIGSLAIFVMVVPYAMIHFGKPFAECVGSVFAGIALGTIALRTRSIWGGVAVHCAVAWSMDVFALLGKGEFAKLLAR